MENKVLVLKDMAEQRQPQEGKLDMECPKKDNLDSS